MPDTWPVCSTCHQPHNPELYCVVEQVDRDALNLRLVEEERARQAALATVVEPLLQFFVFTHLPAHLQEVSAPFYDLARRLVYQCPGNDQREQALLDLLRAKDAAVRSMIYKSPVVAAREAASGGPF